MRAEEKRELKNEGPSDSIFAVIQLIKSFMNGNYERKIMHRCFKFIILISLKKN